MSNSKPYSRGEVVEMIAQIQSVFENGNVYLTDIDKELFEEMKKEFAQELTELSGAEIMGYKHLLDWRDNEKLLVVQMRYTMDSSLSINNIDRNMVYRNALEVSLYSDILQNISFYNRSQASYEIGGEDPYKWKPRYSRYPWNTSSDSYVVFGGERTSIQLGKDSVLWGPGYHGTIGLAAIDPSFDMVRLHAKMWRINFTSLLGFLRDDLTKKYQSDLPKKYLSAHRIEITPISGICIAWQEAYIYAENLHIELLNPIMPYQMAEDYLGDIGNNTMEGDLEILLIPNTKLYASLFLDDFHPDQNPLKFKRSKWAMLYGAMIVDLFGVENTDIVLEYARVEPWTYGHKGTHQDPPIPTAYSHFGEPLGHWIGPNADDLLTKIGWQISKRAYGSLSYNRVRNGEIGGNIYDLPIDYGEDKEFLGGIVESRRTIEVRLEYTTFQRFEIVANYSHIGTKNRQKEEAKLSKDHEGKQDWEPGWNTTENKFRLAIQFKY